MASRVSFWGSDCHKRARASRRANLLGLSLPEAIDSTSTAGALLETRHSGLKDPGEVFIKRSAVLCERGLIEKPGADLEGTLKARGSPQVAELAAGEATGPNGDWGLWGGVVDHV
jgi:hypothetical protein